MTGPLLLAFAAVVALDISRGQLENAKQLIAERAGRVVFTLIDRPIIPVRDGTCSAMFSCHVFQHFSTFTGIVQYLRESYRVLESGGSICFHIPVPGAHGRSARSSAWLALWNARATLWRSLGRRRLMEYHRYPATRVFQALAEAGFRDPELRVFATTSNDDPHSFFFARKP
jgi:ubiquinone/menaquinone biosynthesis C-methylase UbiE